jgi:pimeloyl-ACP methyl ester carboxylesterase
VLVGPFVREPGTSGLMRLMTRAAMAPLWAAASWNSYLPKLYAGRKPDDFAQYRSAVSTAIKKTGHAKAFSMTTRTRHDAAAAALGSVKTPVLVIMGDADPDFAKPDVEANWIADQVNGSVLMVPEAGHYPQAQRPELVGPAIAAFANEVHGHA